MIRIILKNKKIIEGELNTKKDIEDFLAVIKHYKKDIDSIIDSNIYTHIFSCIKNDMEKFNMNVEKLYEYFPLKCLLNSNFYRSNEEEMVKYCKKIISYYTAEDLYNEFINDIRPSSYNPRLIIANLIPYLVENFNDKKFYLLFFIKDLIIFTNSYSMHETFKKFTEEERLDLFKEYINLYKNFKDNVISLNTDIISIINLMDTKFEEEFKNLINDNPKIFKSSNKFTNSNIIKKYPQLKNIIFTNLSKSKKRSILLSQPYDSQNIDKYSEIMDVELYKSLSIQNKSYVDCCLSCLFNNGGRNEEKNVFRMILSIFNNTPYEKIDELKPFISLIIQIFNSSLPLLDYNYYFNDFPLEINKLKKLIDMICDTAFAKFSTISKKKILQYGIYSLSSNNFNTKDYILNDYIPKKGNKEIKKLTLEMSLSK